MSKISQMPAATALDGTELFEVIQGGVNKKITSDELYSSGKSAYEIALANGFVGTEVQFIGSLKGVKGDAGLTGTAGAPGVKGDAGLTGTAGAPGVKGEVGLPGVKGDTGLTGVKGDTGLAGTVGTSGKTAYASALDGGFVGNEAAFNASLASPKGINGGVFITDIQPQAAGDNVGNKTLSSDNYSVLQCVSTSKQVKVLVTAISGHKNYRPNIKVNGVPVVMTAKVDAPLFTGIATITLADPVNGSSPVLAEHEDGATWLSTVTLEALPVVTAAIFTSTYPGTQTELKAGDKMAIRVTADQAVVGYEIDAYGAFIASSGVFVSGTVQNIANLTVADRGNVVSLQSFRIRVQKANGSWSAWFNSSAGGAVERTHMVKLNNLYPALAVTGITYPAGQTAIKAGESAVVDHSAANYSTIAYASTQLTIAQPSVFQAAKSVSYLSGTYNDIVQNFTVTAVRAENGASSTAGVVVVIANASADISITLPATRLRSGGNAGTVVQTHLITLTSTQMLTEAPALNAPEGTWLDAVWAPNAAKTVWTRRLSVHDNNAKGTFSFNSLSAKGMSGRIQNTIAAGASYVLGGFVFRTLTVPAFPNREVSIGTSASDAVKLRCTNLGKGASGSLNFAYQAAVGDVVNAYTVTGPTKTANAAGNLWYNCDSANASSNTGGIMTIELEETI